MVAEFNCQQRIQHFGWPELRALWQAIQDGDTPGWESGKALEYFILRAFELENAEVRYPYSVPMAVLPANSSQCSLEQIDGVVYANGLACLVESKDYQAPINFEPIAKLRSQLMRRPSATIASIFSLSGFTEPAKALLGFIQPQTILAWEKDDIDYCLKEQKFCDSLLIKYRKAIEEGLYSFSIRGDLL